MSRGLSNWQIKSFASPVHGPTPTEANAEKNNRRSFRLATLSVRMTDTDFAPWTLR